jgi:hypothetical protein
MNVRWVLFLGAGLAVGAVGGYLLAASPAQMEAYQVPAWLEVVQRVCTSVGGLGTFAALLFVVRQFNLLRAQNDWVQKNVRASLDAQLYARLDSFNKFVVEHDAEYDMLGKSYGQVEPAAPRARLHHLCDMAFTFYEQILKYHVRYDLLDTEDWEEWQRNMAHFFGKPYVRGYWQATRDRYSRRFQAFADGLVARTGPGGAG